MINPVCDLRVTLFSPWEAFTKAVIVIGLRLAFQKASPVPHQDTFHGSLTSVLEML